MSGTMIKKQLESSEIQTGACVFCGQIYQFETDGRASEERLDQWATNKCDCGDAKRNRERLNKEKKATDSIQELIGNDYPEIVDMLYIGVDMILEEKITKLQIDTGRATKVSVAVNSKGNIKVECTTTKKKSKEV